MTLPKKIDWRGKWMTFPQIAAITGIDSSTLRKRHQRGIRGEELLTALDPTGRPRRANKDGVLAVGLNGWGFKCERKKAVSLHTATPSIQDQPELGS